jgi:membrane protein
VPALFDRIGAGITAARKRRPALDHAVRTVLHYNDVKGNMQAGGITYFGFLSFFPLLALGFFVVGYVGRVYPYAREDLTRALTQLFPGVIGTGEGQISLQSIQNLTGTLGLFGLLGVLYAGLGWLSNTRAALQAVFEVEPKGFEAYLIGKVRDLLTMAVVGATLVISVAVSGVTTSFSSELLDWVGLSTDLTPVLTGLSVLTGIAASAVLFFALFRLLAHPPNPSGSLWYGAVVGAVGFELLKQASRALVAHTAGQPAFQAFGIALILLVLINYFSRVILYAASWAHTSPTARSYRALRHEALGVTPPEEH